MAIIDVVRFDGLRSRDWLIYKFPSEKLVLGSQLIVQEGQIAIFAKGGSIADVFYPGTYTLHTDNLPILKTIVNIPFGGDTPFSAEVYFMNTTVRLDINWGITDPIQLIDPKYFVKLRIRGFGRMALKVDDASLIFKEIIGGMQKNDVVKFELIKDYFKGVIVTKVKTAIADTIITKGVSALEIAAKIEELSNNVKEEITPEIKKFGFTLINFYIQSINFPEEDFNVINKILEDKAAFEIMGDNRYTTMRSFDVYEGAANNQSGVAGVFAAGGVGLGAAMGMANHMQNVVDTKIPSKTATKTCKNCGASIDKNNKFCPECGFREEVKECLGCHAIISANSKFCPECGFDYRERFCDCGFKLTSGTKFCPECGKKVE